MNFSNNKNQIGKSISKKARKQKQNFKVRVTKVRRLPTYMYHKRWDERNKMIFYRCTICFNELRSRKDIHWYHRKSDFKLVQFRCQKCSHKIISPVISNMKKFLKLKKELRCYHCFKTNWDRRQLVLERTSSTLATQPSKIKRKKSISAGSNSITSLTENEVLNDANTLNPPSPLPKDNKWTSQIQFPITATLNNTNVDENENETQEVVTELEVPFNQVEEGQISPYGGYLASADENLVSQWEESWNDLVSFPGGGGDPGPVRSGH